MVLLPHSNKITKSSDIINSGIFSVTLSILSYFLLLLPTLIGAKYGYKIKDHAINGLPYMDDLRLHAIDHKEQEGPVK